MMDNTNPPGPGGHSNPPSSNPDDFPAEEESEEVARLRETAKIAPWIEIARSNTDKPPQRKRRFRRRRG